MQVPLVRAKLQSPTAAGMHWVHMLLWATDSLKRASLNVQGEVEQISLMKAKSTGPHDTGLLEYLEDIVGTDKYVEEIEGQAKQ